MNVPRGRNASGTSNRQVSKDYHLKTIEIWMQHNLHKSSTIQYIRIIFHDLSIQEALFSLYVFMLSSQSLVIKMIVEKLWVLMNQLELIFNKSFYLCRGRTRRRIGMARVHSRVRRRRRHGGYAHRRQRQPRRQGIPLGANGF